MDTSSTWTDRASLLAAVTANSSALVQPLTNLLDNGLAVKMFGATLPTLQISLPGSGSVTFSNGQLQLTLSAAPGGPFSFINQLDLAITVGIDIQMIRISFSMSLSQLFDNLFGSSRSGAMWDAVSKILEALDPVFASPTLILSTADGSDGDYDVTKGVNFYQAIPLKDVPPLSLIYLNQTVGDAFTHLVGSALNAPLLVHLAVDPAGTIAVDADLLLNQSLCRAVTLNSIGISAQSSLGVSNELDADIAFTVNAGGTQLALTGGLGIKQAEGVTLHAYGRLAADKPWVDPMGAKGITIKGLAVDMGVTSTFPWVTLGFDGSASIGGNLLGGTMALYLDPSDPLHTVLELSSPQGLSLPKLLGSLVTPSLSSWPMLDVSLKDIDLYFSPNGGNIAGKSYDRGFKLGGSLDLWGWKAALDGKFDYTSGGYLTGTMDVLQINAGGVQLIKITDAAGTGSPVMKVYLTSSQQSVLISGRISLLNGSYAQAVNVIANQSGFALTLATTAVGLYAGATLSYSQGSFNTSLSGSFSTQIGSVPVRVNGFVQLHASQSSFVQSLSFSYAVGSTTHILGPFPISVPIATADDLRAWFMVHGFTTFMGQAFTFLKSGSLEAFQWVKAQLATLFTDADQQLDAAISAFVLVMCPLETVSRQLSIVYGRTARDVLSALKRTCNFSAATLAHLAKDVYNISATGTAQILQSLGFKDKETAAALKAVNYTDDAIQSAMSTVWGWTTEMWKTVYNEIASWF